jgi:putative DNA topoisomerase
LLTRFHIKIKQVILLVEKNLKKIPQRTIQIVQKRKIVKTRNIVKPTKRISELLKNEIDQYFDANGYLSWSAKKKKYIILGTNTPKNGLVLCPKCNLGQLMVIRSNRTRKRFIGCSNYYNGCRASSPLLQKARLRALKQKCTSCFWPIILFRYSRKQKWARQCANINCETRISKA